VSGSEPINQLYSRKILGFASDIPHVGRLDNPQASGHAVSRLCGSEIHLDIRLDENGAISDFAQDIKACALGQTAASVVGHNIMGAKAEDIDAAHNAMSKMLKDNGPAPPGRFKDLEVLLPVKDYSARHASVMLVLDALKAAFDDAQESQNS